MEHYFVRISLIICSIFLLNACEKPLAEPEIVDPIYQDLRSDQTNAEKLVEDKKKEIESNQAALEKSPEMSEMDRKHAQALIFKAQKELALIDQDTRYFKLRAETRKALDRDMYPAIFKSKGKWPDLEEFDRYKAEKRLKGASRNWNDRVPRPPGAPTKDNPVAEKKSEAKPEDKTKGMPEGAEKKD